MLGATIVSILPFEFTTMTSRLTLNDVLEELGADDYRLSSNKDSDFEGDGICSYLSEVLESFTGDHTVILKTAVSWR